MEALKSKDSSEQGREL